MEYIEMMVFGAIANKGYDEIASQHYKYANVSNNNNIIQGLVATRYTRIEAHYTDMVLI